MEEGSTCDTEGAEIRSSQFADESSQNSTANTGVVAAVFVAVLFLFSVYRWWRQRVSAASYVSVCTLARSEVPDSALREEQQCLSDASVKDHHVSDNNSVKSSTIMNASRESESLLSGVQEDTFFTWDSGGNSGEFATDSFVHTAVELSKYREDCMTEEEKQMLLYAQNNTAISTDLDPNCFVINRAAETNDRLDAFRDYNGTGTRGFLETIVEENSDDLRSPSECDESSLGWGSWDESDDDRVTVVEVQTTASQSQNLINTVSQCNTKSAVLTNNSDFSLISSESLNTQFPQNRDDSNELSLSSLSSFNIDEIPYSDSNDSGSVLYANNVENFYNQPPTNITSFNFDNNKYSDVESQPRRNSALSTTNSTGLQQNSSINPCLFQTEPDVIGNKFAIYNSDSLTDQDAFGANSESSWFRDKLPSYEIQSCSSSVEEDNRRITSEMCADGDQDLTYQQQQHVFSFLANNKSVHDENEKCYPSDDVMIERESGVCLIPSPKDVVTICKSSEEICKDYFLPAERYVPLKFEQNNTNNCNDFLNITDNNEKLSKEKDESIRCLRIGFNNNDRENEEQFYTFNDEESEICKANGIAFEPQAEAETLSTPRDGDVAFGTPWFDGHRYKEPEAPSDNELRAETLPLTIDADVGRSTMPLLEPISLSPTCERRKKALFDKPASDDELGEVSSSLSRWQHHTDLQKLEEVTSPLSRWQHQQNLFKVESDSQINNSHLDSEEEQSNLTEQLKNIYSSSKMQDRKMSRIKIKGTKKCKGLGLWENETKVTLPPFSTDQKLNSCDINPKKSSKGDLDDLELDMFATTPEFESLYHENYTPVTNGNSLEIKRTKRQISNVEDVGNNQRIKSSKSLENFDSNMPQTTDLSESIKQGLSGNKRSKSSTDLLGEDIYNELMEISKQESMKMLKYEDDLRFAEETHHMHDISNLKNTDELDQADKCPLCKDAKFLKSDKLFLPPLQKSGANSDLLHLLNKTYPQMSQIYKPDILTYSEKITSQAEEVNKAKILDSPSPVTSSDSDEGVANVRCEELKKKNKKRSCTKEIHENKHDDSGYVEDDEDDEEDDMPEDDDHLRIRKSIESLKNKANIWHSNVQHDATFHGNGSKKTNTPDLIIEATDKFTAEISTSVTDNKHPGSSTSKTQEQDHDFCAKSEKWSVPPRLSEFSAWLLDRELAKLSSKDLMEKLIVSDILNLREQTIKQFLEDSNDQNVQENIKNISNSSSDSKSFEPETKFSVEKLINSDKMENIIDLDIEDKNLNSIKHTTDTETHSININYLSTDKFFTAENANEQWNEDKTATHSESLNIDTDFFSLNYQENQERDSPFEIPNKQIFNNKATDSNLLVENILDSESSVKIFNSEYSQLRQKHLNHTEIENEDFLNDSLKNVNIQNDFSERKTSADISQVCDLSPYIFSNVAEEIDNNNTELIISENNASDSTYSSDIKDNSTAFAEETPIILALESKSLNSSIESESKLTSLLVSRASYTEDQQHFETLEVCMLPSMGEKMKHNTSEPGSEGSEASGLQGQLTTLETKVVEQTDASPKESREEGDVTEACIVELHGTNVQTNQHRPTLRYDDVTELEHVFRISGNTALAEEQRQPSVSSDAKQTNVTPSQLCAKPVEWKESEQSDLLQSQQNNQEINNPFELSEDSRKDSFVISPQPADKNADNDDPTDNAQVFSELTPPSGYHHRSLLSSKDVTDLKHVQNKTAELFNSDISDTLNDSSLVHTLISDANDLISESVIRCSPVEYRRSRSLVREDDPDDEIELLTWNKQFKSSPDLRQCEEGFSSASSGPPLSALLSKSVSQRIQDYLDQKNRGSLLNRSLPPNERSRHYRRICVSTETVVERAARFESRHRSLSSNGCSRQPPTSNYTYAEPRSGSCPPLGAPRGIQNISTCVGSVSATASGKKDSFLSRHQSTMSGRRWECARGPHLSLLGNNEKNTSDQRRSNGFSHNFKKTKTENEVEDLIERITAYEKASSTVSRKPPLPTTRITITGGHNTAGIKGRIASARKDFFEKLSRQKSSGTARTKGISATEEKVTGFARLDVFRRSAREERDRLAASHPDLGALETAVRSSRRRIDALEKKKSKNHVVADKLAPSDFHKTNPEASDRRDRDSGIGGGPSTTIATTTTTTAAKERAPVEVPYRRCTGEIAWASCARRLREAREKERSRSQSYLETDIDSHEQRPPAAPPRSPPVDGSARARSLLALSEALAAAAAQHQGDDDEDEDGGAAFDEGKSPVDLSAPGEELFHCRARSMDFLLDEHNRERALPPENRLGSAQGRVKSEHELRVERSLQNLTVPDWYKRSAWSTKPKEGFILRRGSEGAASEASNKRRWKGFSSSRTPSASSLASNSYSQRSVVIPKRITAASSTDWRYGSSLMSSRESLPPASPASLSPRDCSTFQYSSLSRWSSARLSTGSAPITAWTANRSFRQPYLGWRAAAASTAQTPTSCSRSSPGVSPAASSPLYGSRPVSPRRSSQEPHTYPAARVTTTSSATLRPESGDAPDTNRISPLALYDNANGVFFSTEIVVPPFDDVLDASKTNRAYDDKYRSTAWPTLRRDRYSYTQSLYNPGVLVSPGGLEEDGRDTALFGRHSHEVTFLRNAADDEKNKMLRSPQLSPRIWMESSFVGTKKNEVDANGAQTQRNVSTSDRDTTQAPSYARAVAASSSIRSTCAPTKQMGEYTLRDFRRFGITL